MLTLIDNKKYYYNGIIISNVKVFLNYLDNYQSPLFNYHDSKFPQ